jgi:hypothetical protein
MSSFSASPFRENRGFSGVPPSPYPLNTATGAGFAKMLCKILSGEGLEVKILSTNELDPCLAISACTPPP